MESVDDILAHYGIMGMKWGVRRDRAQLARTSGKKTPDSKTPSEDSAKASAARSKAKKGGVRTLSNQELQDLTNRMNLEQSYNRLSGQKSKLEKGKARVGQILSLGKTANDVAAFAASPMGRQLLGTIKTSKSN
jgi:hypothetical protein